MEPPNEERADQDGAEAAGRVLLSEQLREAMDEVDEDNMEGEEMDQQQDDQQMVDEQLDAEGVSPEI